MKKPRIMPTTDAVQILHRRHVDGKPDMLALLETERANARIAQAIYDLRVGMGLSQRAFAQRVGTTASVICRLEDADYEGHSTAMLERIAKACGKRLVLDVRFVTEPRVKARERRPKKLARA
jgi:ribosome-binding protein aMBF1 (putative translation factor)